MCANESMAATGAAGAGGERLAAVREWWAEYEYGILDGAAVMPQARLRQLERQLAAAMPDLLVALDAARARLAELQARYDDLNAETGRWGIFGVQRRNLAAQGIHLIDPEITEEDVRIAEALAARLAAERAVLDAARAYNAACEAEAAREPTGFFAPYEAEAALWAAVRALGTGAADAAHAPDAGAGKVGALDLTSALQPRCDQCGEPAVMWVSREFGNWNSGIGPQSWRCPQHVPD